MRRIIGNTVAVLAATSALAAPEVARAGGEPTLAQMKQTFQQDFNSLTSSTSKFVEHAALKRLGNVVVTVYNNVPISPDGQVKGSEAQIQVDAMSKRSHTLEETVVDIIEPKTKTATNTLAPGSMFQLDLSKIKYDRPTPPKTPAGYEKAIVKAAEHNQKVDHYSFTFGIQPETRDNWQVLSNSGTFMTNPNQTTIPTVQTNYDLVTAMIKQGDNVLHQVERFRIVPQAAMADLVPTHMR